MELTRKENPTPWPLLEHSLLLASVTPHLPVYLLSVNFTGTFCFTWVSSRFYPSLLFLLYYFNGSPRQVSESVVSWQLLEMQIAGLFLESQDLFTKLETLEAKFSNNLCFSKLSRWFWMQTRVCESLFCSLLRLFDPWLGDSDVIYIL